MSGNAVRSRDGRRSERTGPVLFYRQVVAELRKVVWPTRKEASQTTLVVFGFVIVFGIFFWLLDLVLAWATKTLTGQGG